MASVWKDNMLHVYFCDGNMDYVFTYDYYGHLRLSQSFPNQSNFKLMRQKAAAVSEWKMAAKGQNRLCTRKWVKISVGA